MDNHHVRISPLSCTCAGVELSQLGENPLKIMYQLATHMYHPARGSPAAFVVWSDVTNGRGTELYSTIRAEVLAAYPVREIITENPKTGNEIEFFTWLINHTNFKKWWINERVRRARCV